MRPGSSMLNCVSWSCCGRSMSTLPIRFTMTWMSNSRRRIRSSLRLRYMHWRRNWRRNAPKKLGRCTVRSSSPKLTSRSRISKYNGRNIKIHLVCPKSDLSHWTRLNSRTDTEAGSAIDHHISYFLSFKLFCLRIY